MVDIIQVCTSRINVKLLTVRDAVSIHDRKLTPFNDKWNLKVASVISVERGETAKLINVTVRGNGEIMVYIVNECQFCLCVFFLVIAMYLPSV